MPARISLRSKLGAIFIAMAVVVLLGGGIMLWYTRKMDTMLLSMVNKEFVLYKTAQEMELALAHQKGLLTYYLVDGDIKWLKSLGQYRQVFYQIIEQAQRLELTPEQHRALEIIAEKYDVYIRAKDVAIDNYQTKQFDGDISSLHERQREAFFGVLDLCRAFSKEQWQVIMQEQKDSNILSERIRIIDFIAISLFTVLCSALLFILFKHILEPIRGLAIETGSSPQDSSRDEVNSLTLSLKGMIQDLGETSDALTKSRKNLQYAERMAMVGELAAGVAHTIRNPFTSIKMRMFSLRRSLSLTEAQTEDLQVISDEIARIDRIVENFLEFARPPKLRLKYCYLRDIVNSVTTLLEYRLKAYNVDLQTDFQTDAPQVKVDADRMKEALVNLIINSCEAMEKGGAISIKESRQDHPVLGDVEVITVSDNGPGIPESVIDKITTPFFTTKEDGSGLGLSIVTRILREHDGRLQVTSKLGAGTQCSIFLPVRGHEHGSDSYN